MSEITELIDSLLESSHAPLRELGMVAQDAFTEFVAVHRPFGLPESFTQWFITKMFPTAINTLCYGINEKPARDLCREADRFASCIFEIASRAWISERFATILGMAIKLKTQSPDVANCVVFLTHNTEAIALHPWRKSKLLDWVFEAAPSTEKLIADFLFRKIEKCRRFITSGELHQHNVWPNCEAWVQWTNQPCEHAAWVGQRYPVLTGNRAHRLPNLACFIDCAKSAGVYIAKGDVQRGDLVVKIPDWSVSRGA